MSRLELCRQYNFPDSELYPEELLLLAIFKTFFEDIDVLKKRNCIKPHTSIFYSRNSRQYNYPESEVVKILNDLYGETTKIYCEMLNLNFDVIKNLVFDYIKAVLKVSIVLTIS